VDAVVCFKELIEDHFEIIDKLKSGELSDGTDLSETWKFDKP
jgi:hypothetical protein